MAMTTTMTERINHAATLIHDNQLEQAYHELREVLVEEQNHLDTRNESNDDNLRGHAAILVVPMRLEPPERFLPCFVSSPLKIQVDLAPPAAVVSSMPSNAFPEQAVVQGEQRASLPAIGLRYACCAVACFNMGHVWLQFTFQHNDKLSPKCRGHCLLQSQVFYQSALEFAGHPCVERQSLIGLQLMAASCLIRVALEQGNSDGARFWNTYVCQRMLMAPPSVPRIFMDALSQIMTVKPTLREQATVLVAPAA